MKTHCNQAPAGGRSVVIDKLDVTSDTLTGRGGLNLLVKYLTAIGIFSLLSGKMYQSVKDFIAAGESEWKIVSGQHSALSRQLNH
jgi:hypothetical protein